MMCLFNRLLLFRSVPLLLLLYIVHNIHLSTAAAEVSGITVSNEITFCFVLPTVLLLLLLLLWWIMTRVGCGRLMMQFRQGRYPYLFIGWYIYIYIRQNCCVCWKCCRVCVCMSQENPEKRCLFITTTTDMCAILSITHYNFLFMMIVRGDETARPTLESRPSTMDTRTVWR